MIAYNLLNQDLTQCTIFYSMIKWIIQYFCMALSVISSENIFQQAHRQKQTSFKEKSHVLYISE